jgi:sodium/potassium-transporting ATPase subunit alpha
MRKAGTSKDARNANAITWQHCEEPAEVANRLDTDLELGLSSEKVRWRLAKHGYNVLTPALQKPWWRQLLSHFTDFFSLLLLFASALCLLAYALDPSEDIQLFLAGFLFAVVVATSLFSYAQQYKSDQTLREFRNMLPPKATVLRDGGFTQLIPAADLVVGDLVQIKMGDKVPADVRIVKSQGLSVDNSALTGESEPCERVVHMTSGIPLESANLAFFGTLAVDGAATGVVIATGDATVFGNIAHLASDAQDEAGNTTLHHDIHHFVVNITVFAMVVGVFCFIVGIIKGAKLLQNIVYSIGIIVSNVPEGLLATVTVSLTASARRMARRNVLVKNLEAIETLGSTTMICSDKTGTLTQNRMTVAHLAYAGKVEVMHANWAPPVFAEEVTSVDDRSGHDCLQALIFGATNCATATFDHADVVAHPEKTIDELDVSGDASEAGILRFTERIHRVAEERARNPELARLPFNSANKYMVTVHRKASDPSFLRLVMKGAPERILDRCSRILVGNETERPLGERDRELVEKQVAYLANRGERVLAYAHLDLSPHQASHLLPSRTDSECIDESQIPTEELCFIGLISLVDPPRESVPNAVGTCKSAGIGVIMITGDHPATALSIAKQVGIVTLPVTGDGAPTAATGASGQARVVSGHEIEHFTEDMWDRVLAYEQIVFARTSPHQKLLIVQQLQRLGHIVAVSGDGVNDSPALKMANIGVAMGISGSEVSKEAADIVLLDDNFASIVSGVEEGRLIFDNLKKSISYTLTSNVPQLMPFIVFLILQVPLPLCLTLVLAIDLGTDIFPAISFAYEKPEWDLMRRPPRNLMFDRLFNPPLVSFSMLQLGIIQSFGGFFAYLVVLNDYGLTPATLPRLDRSARFGTERLTDQRWMFTEQSRADGFAFRADWFAADTPGISPFFSKGKAPTGFIEQTEERFNRLLASEKQTTSGVRVTASPQFNNMVKVIAKATGRPPCLEYACILDGTATMVRNDRACFDEKYNTNPVYLTGILDGKKNEKVKVSRGVDGGCFELWTPRQERGVLQIAQTAFFASVVVTQIFTLIVTKTRMLSVFQQGAWSSAVVISLTMECVIASMLIYIPFISRGLAISPLRAVEWLPGVPFGLLIFGYDEGRKWFIRKHLVHLNKTGAGTAGPKSLVDRIAGFVYTFTMW